MKNIQNNTEELLIEGAVSYINKYGYQNLSVRKFTKEINMTTGAFYKHFKDKHELYVTLLHLLSEKFLQDMPNIKGKSSFNQLFLLADYFISYAKKSPNIINFILFTDTNATYVFNSEVDNLGTSLRKKFEELIKDLNHSQLSNDDFFLQIWAFIQGYLLMVKNDLTEYSPELVKFTLEQLVKEK